MRSPRVLTAASLRPLPSLRTFPVRRDGAILFYFFALVPPASDDFLPNKYLLYCLSVFHFALLSGIVTTKKIIDCHTADKSTNVFCRFWTERKYQSIRLSQDCEPQQLSKRRLLPSTNIYSCSGVALQTTLSMFSGTSLYTVYLKSKEKRVLFHRKKKILMKFNVPILELHLHKLGFICICNLY